MILFLRILLFLVFVSGCATKSLPKSDISNAKMAIAQSDNKIVRTYAKKELQKLKQKYKKLDTLLKEKRYKEAKFLAQEIQADSMLLQKKASVIELEKKVKTKENMLLDINETKLQEEDL